MPTGVLFFLLFLMFLLSFFLSFFPSFLLSFFPSSLPNRVKTRGHFQSPISVHFFPSRHLFPWLFLLLKFPLFSFSALFSLSFNVLFSFPSRGLYPHWVPFFLFSVIVSRCFFLLNPLYIVPLVISSSS